MRRSARTPVELRNSYSYGDRRHHSHSRLQQPLPAPSDLLTGGLRICAYAQSQEGGNNHLVPDSQPLHILVSRARRRSETIVKDIAASFRAEVPGYGFGDGLDDEAVRDNVRGYVVAILDRLEGLPTDQSDGLEEFMRRRIDSGITLTSLLQAYRLGAAVIWKALATLVRDNGAQQEALVTATPALFELLESYSQRAHAIYREIEIRDARRNEQVRATMIDTILSQQSTIGADYWSAAAALGIPRDGLFAVVVAESDTASAREMPADVEALIGAHPAVEDVWFRLSPDPKRDSSRSALTDWGFLTPSPGRSPRACRCVWGSALLSDRLPPPPRRQRRRRLQSQRQRLNNASSGMTAMFCWS